MTDKVKQVIQKYLRLILTKDNQLRIESTGVRKDKKLYAIKKIAQQSPIVSTILGYHLQKATLKKEKPFQVYDDLKDYWPETIPAFVLEYKDFWEEAQDLVYVSASGLFGRQSKASKEQIEKITGLKAGSKRTGIDGKVASININLDLSKTDLTSSIKNFDTATLPIMFLSWGYKSIKPQSSYGIQGSASDTGWVISEHYRKLLKPDQEIVLKVLNYFQRSSIYPRSIKDPVLIEAKKLFELLALPILENRKIQVRIFLKGGQRLEFLDIQKLVSKPGNENKILKILDLQDTDRSYFTQNDTIYFYDRNEIKKNKDAIIKYLINEDLEDFMEMIDSLRMDASIKTTNRSFLSAAKKGGLTAVLQEHQKSGASWLWNLYDQDIPGALLADEMGMGKALDNNTLVKIPNGWKKIKDLHINEKVIGRDGLPTKITGVYPQGLRPTYRIFFDDGREIIADEDHLWQIHSYGFTGVNNVQDKLEKFKILTTKEIDNYYKSPRKQRYPSNNKLYIPLCEPEKKEDIELPLNPYLLGSLLGDGCLVHGVAFSTADQESIERLNPILETYNCKFTGVGRSGYDYNIIRNGKCPHHLNPIKTILKDLGLFKKTSLDKFVPEIYKEASYNQKMELIRGLLDTDGTVEKGGTIIYCTISKRLAEDLTYILRSIGAIVKTKERKSWQYLNGKKFKQGYNSFNLTIRFKNQKELFSLTRKNDRLKTKSQYTEGLMLGIKKIEKFQERETTCIAVDNSDKLFVIENFVVTHNTNQTITFLSGVGINAQKKALIVCPASVVPSWENEFNKFNPRLAKKIGTDIQIMSYEKAANAKHSPVEILVLDEVQKIKNNRSKTFASIAAIDKKFAILLSGTPIENKVDDLISVLQIIEPSAYDMFLILKRAFPDTLELAARLKHTIEPLYLSRKKTKDQLTAKFDVKDIPVQPSAMDAKIQKKIQEIYSDKLLKIKAGNNHDFYQAQVMLTGLLRMRQALSYPGQLAPEVLAHFPEALQREALQKPSNKELALLKLWQEIKNRNEKVVIFTMFSPTVEHLADSFRKKGAKVFTLQGSDSIAKRKTLIDAFQDPSSRVDVFIISLKAGNSGITLTEANNVIIYDLWYNPAVIAQAMARVHRIGQNKDVQGYVLVTQDTVDERINEIFLKKQDLIKSFESGEVQQNVNKSAVMELGEKMFKGK